MNANQKKVLKVLIPAIKGIDEAKLKLWLKYTIDSDIRDAVYFIFEDNRLADFYHEGEEDLAGVSGYFHPDGDLDEYFEWLYTADGADLDDDEDDDPRDCYFGVIDLQAKTYGRINGYGDYYTYDSQTSDAQEKELNPDFSDWIIH
jgi:hypothetical protein